MGTDGPREIKPPISGRRKLVEAFALIAGSTLAMFILSTIALLMYTGGTRAPTIQTLEIPPGSSELIQDGENPLEIPPTWTFFADDTLILDNRDASPHILGEWSVSPGGTSQIEFRLADRGTLPTSLHPSGGITLEIEPRSFDFSLIAYSTFGFGFSIGIILLVGLTIVRALGRNDHDDWTDTLSPEDVENRPSASSDA
ncbi:MAG: hypothetical protein BMS9Abin20_1327 [Acidimicrobiia bacterium]|nr:MAG: hypothetical protein BMS9Abin20_1327 [Acidimicrobiia bacterium]